MIKIKTESEIGIMRKGGKIAAKALDAALKAVVEGIRTQEIDRISENVILEAGGKPSFKAVKGYDFATCINVNEGLVHGVPGGYVIKKGDIVSVDLGVLYKGFHTDLASTVEVGSNCEREFLDVGKEALEEALSKCLVGNRLGDVSSAIQNIVENAGYTVSRDLVGHGIGRELHEEPQIPGYGKKGEGPLLKNGMVLAVEVICQKGRHEIAVLDDNWTIKTKDSSLAALFEHTVAVTKKGSLVLTKIV